MNRSNAVRHGLKDSEAKHSPYTQGCIDLSVGGEDREDTKERPYGMCGTELCVTRGDPVVHRHTIIDIRIVKSIDRIRT